MKLVLVSDNLVDETLANAIYTENGIMFLSKGYKIKASAIKRLKSMGISTIYIEDGNDEIVLQEVLPTPIMLQIIKKLKEVFEEVFKKELVNEEKVYEIINLIIKNINLSENATMLSNLVANDKFSELAVHSVDVSILAIKLGIQKKYDEGKLIKIAMAALLHDIGKLFVNDKNHVKRGYEILKRNPLITSTIYMAVYYMYEREDGSGLFGVTGSKIHEFAKVIGICNEYVKSVIGANAMLPHLAIEKITAKAISKFDKEIYKEFLESVYCYPNGLNVKLNNGEVGIVVMQNKGFTTRPILALKNNDSYKFCNLVETQNLTLFIEQVIM